MSAYDVLTKKKNKALKVFHHALDELTSVTKSIENLRDSNTVAMQDAREEIQSKQDFIEQKANANSMLQTDLENTNETVTKIKDLLNVR